jgi:hypothetical protein
MLASQRGATSGDDRENLHMTPPRRRGSLAVWYGDWQQRLTDRLREHGFSSATEYVATAPTTSLILLGHALSTDPTVPLFQGDGFAADQLVRRLLDEAKGRGDVERCARGLLVRSLHQHLPDGWRSDWGPDIPGDLTTPVWHRASALGGWSASVAVHVPDCEDALDRVNAALCDAAIPEGWLPASADDPLLVELFRQHWPPPPAAPPARS